MDLALVPADRDRHAGRLELSTVRLPLVSKRVVLGREDKRQRDSREIVGWYLYYLNPGGISEVVQIAARDGCFGATLDHLLYHAWQRGAVAVSGQLDPSEIQAFWGRSCVFHHDGASWVLVHARRPDVLEAIHRGDAFMTRLEGEWWIGP